MKMEHDLKLDYDDVLLSPKRSTLSSREEVDVTRKMKFRHSNILFDGIPVVAANMDGVGCPSVGLELAYHKMMTALTKQCSATCHLTLRDAFWYTIGPREDLREFEKASDFFGWLCIDAANGYSESFIDFVAKARDVYPDHVIVAGNVATPNVTEELVLKGADVVKIGIGPGATCTTRIKTGVGIPQLSAVMECADAAHGLDAHIVADGGCRTPGDVVKAFAAGGDFVMLGSMFAGVKESDMPPDEEGKIPFYGMSSKAANEKHFGGMKCYRTSEGREVRLEPKGSVHDVVHDILGGLRSACAYVGAKRLKDLPKCATFVRCNSTHNKIFGDQ